jgi:Polyketide cyclase / dehydrase and lipid transport
MASFLQISAIAVGVIAIVPFLLPSSKTVQRSGFVNATPGQVFAAASSTAGYQIFNPYRDMDAKLKITPFGPQSGVGAGFAFDGKDGKGTSTIAAVKDNESVTYQIDLGFMGKPVQTISLSPENGGTRVNWAVTSNFGWNPMGRVFGLFMDGMLGPHYELGLRNMARIAAPA